MFARDERVCIGAGTNPEENDLLSSHWLKIKFLSFLLQDERSYDMGASHGVIVSKLRGYWWTIVNELDSHWAPHISGFVSYFEIK